MLQSTIFKTDITSQFTAEPTVPPKSKTIKHDTTDDRFSKSLAAKQQQESLRQDARKQDMLQQRADQKSRQQDALQERASERRAAEANHAEARRNERADNNSQQDEEKTDTNNATDNTTNSDAALSITDEAPATKDTTTSVLTDILTGFDAKAADDALADTANQEILAAALLEVTGDSDAEMIDPAGIVAVEVQPSASPADATHQELSHSLASSTALTGNTMADMPASILVGEEDATIAAITASAATAAATAATKEVASSMENPTLNAVEQAVVSEVTTAMEQVVQQDADQVAEQSVQGVVQQVVAQNTVDTQIKNPANNPVMAGVAAQQTATPTAKSEAKPAVRAASTTNVAEAVPVNLAGEAINPQLLTEPQPDAIVSTSLEESFAAHAAVDRYDGDTAASDSDNTASMINNVGALSEPPVGMEQILSNVLNQASLATQPNSITLPGGASNLGANPGANLGASPLVGADMQAATDIMKFEPVTLDDGSTDWLDMLQKFDQHQANKSNATVQAQQGFKQGSSPAAEQIAMQVRKALETGQEQFRLQLKPARLGSIDVQMTIAQDGAVQAVLNVENPETYDWLQKDRQQLERILQESGLNTNEDSVQLQYRDPQHSNQQSNQDQQQGGNYTRREVVAVETQTVSDAPLVTTYNPNRLDVHI